MQQIQIHTSMYRVLLIIIALVMMGCKKEEPKKTEEESRLDEEYEQSELSLDDLGNSAYLSEHLETGKIELREGAFEDPSRQISVNLGDAYAVGDIDADGDGDAAVVLISTTGGSGVFYDLALVENEGATITNTATVSLGDRVQVDSIAIRPGYVAVSLLTHAPADPLCCPTIASRKYFRLAGNKLVETDSTVAITDERNLGIRM